MLPALEVTALMADLNTQLGDLLTFEEVSSLTQRALSLDIDAHASNKLQLDLTLSVRDKARLQCLERDRAGT